MEVEEALQQNTLWFNTKSQYIIYNQDAQYDKLLFFFFLSYI